jgi:hypothetical protein
LELQWGVQSPPSPGIAVMARFEGSGNSNEG